MSTRVASIAEEQTLRQAGHRMRELGVTALPVYAADGSSRGVISSDMIVRCIAAGGDPGSVIVADLPHDLELAPGAVWAAQPQAVPAA